MHRVAKGRLKFLKRDSEIWHYFLHYFGKHSFGASCLASWFNLQQTNSSFIFALWNKDEGMGNLDEIQRMLDETICLHYYCEVKASVKVLNDNKNARKWSNLEVPSKKQLIAEENESCELSTTGSLISSHLLISDLLKQSFLSPVPAPGKMCWLLHMQVTLRWWSGWVKWKVMS